MRQIQSPVAGETSPEPENNQPAVDERPYPSDMVDPEMHIAANSRTSLEYASESTTEGERPSPKGPSRWKQFDWAGSWTFEILGTALCVIGFSLLIGLLFYVDGKPYADWQYTASPNTIISVIVGISKAAMLVPISSCLGQLKWRSYHNPMTLYNMQVLDQASRGPWGALEVFWTFSPGLATIGVALTVLAVAIDPFSQQILAFPSRITQASNETAYVFMTQTYNFHDKQFDTSWSFGDMPAASMEIAIMNGLFQTVSPLEPRCSTEECHYPDFVTLGICSHCEDMTDDIKQTCTTESDSSQGGLDASSFPRKFREIPIQCSYTTPNDFKFNFGSSNYSSMDRFDGAFNLQPGDIWTSRVRSLPSVYGVQEPKKSISNVFGIQEPTITFHAADCSQRTKYAPDNVTAFPPKPVVTECAIYLCEKQYTSNHISNNHRTLELNQSQQLLYSSRGDMYPDGLLDIKLHSSFAFGSIGSEAREHCTILSKC